MQIHLLSKLKRVAIFGCILAGTARAFAQDVAPPPGFVPGQETDSLPSLTPTPGFAVKIEDELVRHVGCFGAHADAALRHVHHHAIMGGSVRRSPELGGAVDDAT